KPAHSDGWAFHLLWWVSVPVWWVFAQASFRAAEQVNWPAAAYVGGLVLAVAWVREQLAHPARGWRRLTAGCLGTAAASGLVRAGPGRPAQPVRPVAAEPGRRRASVPRAVVRVRRGDDPRGGRGLRPGGTPDPGGPRRGRGPGRRLDGLGGPRIPGVRTPPVGRRPGGVLSDPASLRMRDTDGGTWASARSCA